MSGEITNSKYVQTLLDKASGIDSKKGDERIKTIVRRLVQDLYLAIEDLEMTESEFWHGLHYLQGAAPEYGLIAPGLGFDHFLDLLMDATDKKTGANGGTPRTIEGPLYVEGAPLSDAYAEMANDEPGDSMELSGVVKDGSGNPIAGAIVDIWHASSKGGYSHFDPSLSRFAFRRRIRTDNDGAYKAKSIVPAGYAIPPGSASEALLNKLGRHGNRPSHIHFFVSSPGYKHLTTQINISGDPYLHDDFAFGTRDELIVDAKKDGDVYYVNFDITLVKSVSKGDDLRPGRPRMSA